MATDAPTSSPPDHPTNSRDASRGTTDAVLQDTTTPVNQANADQPGLDQSQHHDPLDDPQVAALRVIFPDYDDGLLKSVLQSVDWDQDRAIDVLLGMNDPQYKSELSNNLSEQAALDIDEQLARRLMLEEHEQQALRLPYQPYSGSTRRGIQAQQPRNAPPEKDTMSDLQDHFSRFAETGKKTFESLFSRVKAKIQEYDRPNKGPESSSVPSWGGAPGSSSERWSHNGAIQPSSYYDPNPPISAVALPSSHPTDRNVHASVQGYDVGVKQDAGTAEPSGTEPTPSPRTSTSARPVTTIDGGKLGLLPKRPVSLLKPPEKTGGQELTRQYLEDDGDDLEYTENPFEDSRH